MPAPRAAFALVLTARMAMLAANAFPRSPAIVTFVSIATVPAHS